LDEGLVVWIKFQMGIGRIELEGCGRGIHD
jgi:hypothetical protein